MSTYTLQDLINLVVYKNKDNRIMCEIYFKGNLECTRKECGELLGDLLEFKVNYNYTDDDELVCSIDKSDINSVSDKFSYYSDITNVLKDCFVDEHFEPYDFYNSREFRHYFDICEQHNIEINIDSFEKYLSTYGIPHKSFTKTAYTKDFDIDNSLGIYSEDYLDKNSIGLGFDEFFINLLKNEDEYKMAYYYYDCQYTDFIFVLTYHLLKNNVILKRCKYCNMYFAQYKPNQKYCERQKMNLDGQFLTISTCSELAYKQVRKDRERNNKIIKLENSTRTMMLNRTKSKSLPIEIIEKRKNDYINFLIEKDKQKQKYNEGLITENEYIQFLKSYRLKKEGEQSGKHTED